MKIINLIVAAVSCLTISGCQYSFSAQCIKSLPSDSKAFGNALAVNEHYLTVGDPQANLVVIYTRNEHSKWLRKREILPPKDSIADKVGFGFGFDVALDQSTLVIGSLTWQKSKETTELKNMTQIDPPLSYSGGIYKTRLDKNIEI